jgi:putative glycosyltransferase (TIGR04372 family)
MVRNIVINVVAFLLIPFLLIIYKIKPYKLYVLYNSSRIGHFSLNVDLFLRRVKLSDIETDKYYFLISPSVWSKGISNKYLLYMQKRYVKTVPRVHYISSSFFYYVFMSLINKDITQHLFYKRYYDGNEVEFSQTKSVWSFSYSEYNRGRRELKKVGIDIDKDRIVCIFARDSAYLEHMYNYINWSHHSFRDMDVDLYVDSIDYLIGNGYKVVRIGSVVKKRVNYLGPNFFDYSFSDIKSDFLDLFLIYVSHFVVGNSSGMVDLAIMFNRPLLIVNGVPFTYAPLGSNDMYIHKKIIDVNSKKIIPFKEILNMNIIREAKGEEQVFREKYGLSYMQNTSEDIYNAVVDMDNYLDGEIDIGADMKEYFSKYWGLTDNHMVRSIVAPSWLENNKNLYY